MAVVPVQENDGPPSTVAEAAVNALGFFLHLRRQILIALDVCAAGRADLDEGEFFAVGGIQVEQPLHAAQPLRDAFRVVDAIDP